MMNLKCIFLIQWLILVVTIINAERTFLRGKYFDDEIQKPEAITETAVQQKWHLQKLDHFESTNITWYQRYYVNEEYYTNSSNSPVYLMVGGEETISSAWMTRGFWISTAIEHGALLFQLEHRFYGFSHPTANTTTENLQYLTIEQALEDTADFIGAMKEIYKLNESNKLIIFGGSYPGNLVAWLRFKYPHLVYGAIASSAPVQAVVDFKDYFKVVEDSLATSSRACVRTISRAFARIDQLSKDATGKKVLTSKFNLCSALESSQDFKNDFSQLNSILGNDISGVVQYSEVDHSNNRTIKNICNILTNRSSGSTSLDRFAALTKVLHNSRCINYNYQNFVNYFRSTSWEHGANRNNEHFIKQCTDLFGEQYNAKFIRKQVRNTNTRYRGKAIVNKVDRVVFVQGSIDPWYPAGVTNSSNPKSPAIFITGAGHCADTLSNDYLQDSPQLISSRQQITNYINAWLSETN